MSTPKRVDYLRDSTALKCQKAVGKAAAKELPSFAAAIGDCIDRVNAGAVTGDSQAQCFGAWTQSGPVSPTDLKTGGNITKAAAKALQSIQTKCSATALASLGSSTCGGGTADGVASCIQCASFAQTAAMISDTY